jgi:tRNA(adenine34) deaminase
LELARVAALEGEVPVGAVVVKDGEIIATGRNRREKGKNALFHAEIEAIDSACKKLGGWRLWQCQLYVTLEPCPMCAGAILNARIPHVYYGATDEKNGACGSVVNLFALSGAYKPQVTTGILEDDCAAILKDFFEQLRISLKTRPKWKKPPQNQDKSSSGCC